MTNVIDFLHGQSFANALNSIVETHTAKLNAESRMQMLEIIEQLHKMIDNRNITIDKQNETIGRLNDHTLSGIGFIRLLEEEIANLKSGLSGRSSLSESSAMLFVFDIESDRYCFWMKDMKFDIDILWLDSKKRIVDAKYAASPSSYPEEFCPKSAARYVLELPAGQALKNGLIIGVQTKF
jgi:uncharacterized membrane protein (UPF0127 family)